MKSTPTGVLFKLTFFKPHLFQTQINSREWVFEYSKSVFCITEANNLNTAKEPES